MCDYMDMLTGRTPYVLEIGVDTGVTFVSLLAHLKARNVDFAMLGVDIHVQEHVNLMVKGFDLRPDQKVWLMEENSLTALPWLVDDGYMFDMVLVDGDHNYHTVSQELRLIKQLTYDHSLVIVDDYSGRWAQRDLWYADRGCDEFGGRATRPIETEKHGVKAAVDNFLADNPGWSFLVGTGEPIALSRTALVSK